METTRKRHSVARRIMDIEPEDESSLYFVIRNGKASLQQVVDDWIDEYKSERDKALLKIERSRCKSWLAEVKQTLKEQPDDSSSLKRVAELKANLAELVRQIESTTVRTVPLGVDQENREYYCLGFMPDCVFIRHPLTAEWLVYSNDEHLEAGLNRKIPCEKALIQALAKRRFRTENTRNVPLAGAYTNRKCKFPIVSDTIGFSRSALLDLEREFSQSLTTLGFSWATEAWQAKVVEACKCSEFGSLLLEHVGLARAPLEALSVCPTLSRRRQLRLWRRFQQTLLLLHALVETAEDFEHLAVCITLYQQILSRFIGKKLNKEASNNSDSESDHEYQCYVCNDGGELICCEGCAHVAHMLCTGLVSVPEGDWFCEDCQERTDMILA